MTVIKQSWFSSFIFLCFPVLATICQTSDAAGSAMIQAINCSTSGNYTPSSAYAANLNQFLAALPENAVTKNGGFFSGTVGDGVATVYGLAMCSTDYSRADCEACLAATAGGNTGGLPNRCPGSTTVHALFDKCLVRYSDINFLGTAETDIIFYSSGGESANPPMDFSKNVKARFQQLTGDAVTSPQRFAASPAFPPYALMQCTWDLTPEQCKQCLDVLSANASDWFKMKTEGERKSYSCTVRYSNTNFTVVPFSDASSGPPMSSSGDQTGTSAPPSTAKSTRAVAMAIGSVSAVGVAALLAGCIWRLRSRSQYKTKVEDGPRKFTYKELERAKGSKLGKGAFGVVYKGNFPGNVIVAIKEITEITSDQVRKAFDNEVKIMKKLHHRNILRLLGWCNEENHLLLVYEIMENGSLEDHLHPKNGNTDLEVHNVMDGGTQLGWLARRNIMIGVATGLTYLHTACPDDAIVHRDIKPANVLLDRNLNAKLADFGLVTQVRHTQTSRPTMNIIGTPAYIDPAYVDTGKACGQSDVYSLGVMLLEVVCGEKPIFQSDNKNSLIEKVLNCESGGGENSILEAADTSLRGVFDQQIKTVLELGLKCVHEDRHKRPHTGKVMQLLMELPPTVPSVSANGTAAASTSHNRQPSEDVYGTCSSDTFPRHSPGDEEAGDAPLMTRN